MDVSFRLNIVVRYIRLMGPTAIGKTAVAVALHELFPIEIVSVDSAMVYREMDIGTGKPDACTLARAPHRLINLRDPAVAYSAAEFATDARREIDDITKRGRVPMLVGGTGLYFRALHHGLSPLPHADPEVRAQIAAQAERLGWAEMHRRLSGVDPRAAERVHPNDRQRIQRALEVWEITGQRWSELATGQRERSGPQGDEVLSLVLAPRHRYELHAAIERRFYEMVESGLVGEVAALKERPDLNANLPSMRAVGYRQVWEHLDGHTSWQEMTERGGAATRQLARRQLTWLRAEPHLEWHLMDGGKTGVAQVVSALGERFERWWEFSAISE